MVAHAAYLVEGSNHINIVIIINNNNHRVGQYYWYFYSYCDRLYQRQRNCHCRLGGSVPTKNDRGSMGMGAREEFMVIY